MVMSQFLVPFEAPYLWPLRSVYRNRTIDLAAIATRNFSAIAAAKNAGQSAAAVTPRFWRDPRHYVDDILLFSRVIQQRVFFFIYFS